VYQDWALQAVGDKRALVPCPGEQGFLFVAYSEHGVALGCGMRIVEQAPQPQPQISPTPTPAPKPKAEEAGK
jgi:hypothetical protein